MTKSYIGYTCVADGCPCNSQYDRVESHMRYVDFLQYQREHRPVTSKVLDDAIRGYYEFCVNTCKESEEKAWASVDLVYRSSILLAKTGRDSNELPIAAD